MTNSHTHAPTAKTEAKEKHVPRNGYSDARGLPKKAGAGNHNWGKTQDNLDELGYNEVPFEGPPKVDEYTAKVQVVDQETFKEIHDSLETTAQEPSAGEEVK
jgi:hypothetical protein